MTGPVVPGWLAEQAERSAARLLATPEHLLGPAGRKLREGLLPGNDLAPARHLRLVR